MKVDFIGQPLDVFSNLMDFFNGALPTATELTVAVAWAKRSGFSRVSQSLSQFRKRGGRSVIVLGIDEGGATKQGLEDALSLFDEVHVFHDRSGRTFHPKIFIAENTQDAVALIGSNNLTAGGSFFNYEAAIQLALDRAEASDEQFLKDVKNYIYALMSDKACIKLTSNALNVLISEKRYQIDDESRPRRRAGGAGVDSDSRLDVGNDSLFGASTLKKRPFVPSSVTVVPPVPLPTSGSALPAAPVVRRWWKRLTKSDAQQPPRTASNPTGNMRLTQARHSIDQTTYFRAVFFGSESWTTLSGTHEEAWIGFDVSVGGNAIGRHRIRIDHDPIRVANQRNAPTFLHWGVLSPLIRQQDYSGCFIVLEKLSSGDYRLIVTTDNPGSAV